MSRAVACHKSPRWVSGRHGSWPDVRERRVVSWQTIGQAHVVGQLEHGLKTGNVAHAYLFVGPPNSGKTTLALEFAQALLCEGSTPPCGTCGACRLALAGAHPDILRFERGVERSDDERRGVERRETAIPDVADVSPFWAPVPIAKDRRPSMLEIKAVGDLVRDSATFPIRGQYHVSVVDASFLQDAASSALLKLLEEPTPSAVHLLCATGDEDLPPPILSRCRILRLRTATRAQLVPWLVSQGETDQRAELIAAASGGRPGLAKQLAEDPKALPELLGKAEHLTDALTTSTLECMELAFAWSKGYLTARAMIVLVGMIWRDLLLLSAGGQADALTLPSLVQRHQLLAAQLGSALVARQLQAVSRASDLLERNVQPRLIVETLLLSLRMPAGSPARGL